MAEGNYDLLYTLILEHKAHLEPGPFLCRPPSAHPAALGFGRIEGMLLGVAIGDGLGNTTEGQTPTERTAAHGEIRDYLPNRYCADQSRGVPSDDTQLTFWTVEKILSDGGLIPESLLERFAAQRIYGIGQAVRDALARWKAGVRPWYACGSESAGNGALMRIAPVILPHLHAPSAALWSDTALATMLTHNDPAALSSCIAWVNVLWQLLSMATAPSPEWWWQTYCAVAQELEGETSYQAGGGAFTDYAGPLWQFVAQWVPEAYRQGLTVRQACDWWYSGAYLLETVPSALYILMRHGHDPEEAIVRAVNDTKDNDSIASIVGGAVGALHGVEALPRRWREGLTGRTGATDDGRVQALIKEAREAFGPVRAE